jgi:hypothetical protein
VATIYRKHPRETLSPTMTSAPAVTPSPQLKLPPYFFGCDTKFARRQVENCAETTTLTAGSVSQACSSTADEAAPTTGEVQLLNSQPDLRAYEPPTLTPKVGNRSRKTNLLLSDRSVIEVKKSQGREPRQLKVKPDTRRPIQDWLRHDKATRNASPTSRSDNMIAVDGAAFLHDIAAHTLPPRIALPSSSVQSPKSFGPSGRSTSIEGQSTKDGTIGTPASIRPLVEPQADLPRSCWATVRRVDRECELLEIGALSAIEIGLPYWSRNATPHHANPIRPICEPIHQFRYHDGDARPVLSRER